MLDGGRSKATTAPIHIIKPVSTILVAAASTLVGWLAATRKKQRLRACAPPGCRGAATFFVL